MLKIKFASGFAMAAVAVLAIVAARRLGRIVAQRQGGGAAEAFVPAAAPGARA